MAQYFCEYRLCLPEQATWDDVPYEIYVPQSVEEGLADFPQLGRMLPEGNFAGVRELFVGKYRLVYTAGNLQVEIIVVLYQAQRR